MLRYFAIIGYILSDSKLVLGCELNLFGNHLKSSRSQSYLMNVPKPIIVFKCNLFIKRIRYLKSLGFKTPNM